MLKKILVLGLCMMVLVGCGGTSSKVADMTLEAMMDKVYEGIAEDQLPQLARMPVTKENAAGFLGTDALDMKEALASEPMMGSIAHSIVLVRLNDGADVEKAKKEIKEKVDPRKWICVGVEPEDVIVDNIENVIILIMTEENAKTIHDNFKKI